MQLDTFTNGIKKLGFFISHYDHILYLENNGTYVAVYIDNLQMISCNLDLINGLKTDMASHFKMTDFGPTAQYLGMKFMQNNDAITVTQTVYINQLLAAHWMSNFNTAKTQMV